MPWETPDEEIERLEAERRRYELTLAGTPESERDRRAQLREWADRRTAEINDLQDKRPLGRSDKFALGAASAVSGLGCFAVESSWPSIALGLLAIVLLDSFRTGVVVRLARKAARRLTPRTHWDKAPREQL